jgi:hypothetical protein
VGTVTSGVAYLSAPFVQRYITSPYPNHRQAHMLFGLFCCVSGGIVASFVKNVSPSMGFSSTLSYSLQIWQLILTQGLIFGIGVGLLNLTSASILNEWFAMRRGLACGIVFGGGGAFGIVLPPFFQKMFTIFGYANSLRIWSGILVSSYLKSSRRNTQSCLGRCSRTIHHISHETTITSFSCNFQYKTRLFCSKEATLPLLRLFKPVPRLRILHSRNLPPVLRF